MNIVKLYEERVELRYLIPGGLYFGDAPTRTHTKNLNPSIKKKAHKRSWEGTRAHRCLTSILSALINGNVLTVDSEKSIAEAVARAQIW